MQIETSISHKRRRLNSLMSPSPLPREFGIIWEGLGNFEQADLAGHQARSYQDTTSFLLCGCSTRRDLKSLVLCFKVSLEVV